MITQSSSVPVVFINQTDRFAETESSVYFFKTRGFFHKNFVNFYKGMSLIAAKRKMRKKLGHRQQRESIHYLRAKGFIKEI